MNKLRERWSAAWYLIVCFFAVGCVHFVKHHNLSFALFWSIGMSVIALMFTKKTRIIWRPATVGLAVVFIAAIAAVGWVVF